MSVACRLDKVGNWAKFYNNGTDDERTHNAVNEITARAVGGTAKNPTWDNTGCLSDDGENFTYKYDFRNRLVEVTRKGGNKLAAYSYDGLNRRIRKVVFDTDGTTETSDARFLYDGWRCVEERNENDSHKLLARYVYGGLYIDEPLRMYRDTDADGDFADAGDVNVYYLQDRLFNVVALTDTDGAIVERTWYEPYGKPTNRRESDGDETLASHFGSPALFAGYSFDAETGLYACRSRYFHSAFGRFTARDAVEAGVNLYEYALSSPAAAYDWNGLWPEMGDKIINADDAKKHAITYQNRGNGWYTNWLAGTRPGRWAMNRFANQHNIPEFARAVFFQNLARVASLGYGFNPGIRTGGLGDEFVYTCKEGWIDIGHYMITAGYAYLNGEQAAMQAGMQVEQFQYGLYRLTQLPAPLGPIFDKLFGDWAGSAFTPEDLWSDHLGALAGQAMMDDLKKQGKDYALESLKFWKQPKPIQPYDMAQRLFDDLTGPNNVKGAVDPANNALGNHKAKYWLEKGIREWVDTDKKGGKVRVFDVRHVKAPYHECVCDENDKPINVGKK